LDGAIVDGFIIKEITHCLKMITAEQREWIAVTASGLKSRKSDAEIVRLLLSCGLSQERASEVFDLIRHGIRSGVNVAVMNGLPEQQNKRGESELYDAAFDEGYKAVKKQMYMTWLRWLIILIGLALAIGTIVFLV
jgi:hypothetical protein